MNEAHSVEPEAGLFLRGLERLASGIDADGRPLLERDASATLRAGVDFELVRCPYSGSREGLPMNGSALAAIHACWPAALDLLLSLAAGLGPARRSPRALLEVAVAAVAAPGWMSLRHGAAPSLATALPSSVAAIHKIAAGVARTTRGLVVTRGPEGELDAVAVLDAAERSGQLIGVDEVCAGPPARILEAVACMLGEGSSRSTEQPFGDALLPVAELMADRALLCLAAELADLRVLGRAEILAAEDLLWGIDLDALDEQLEAVRLAVRTLPAELLADLQAELPARLPEDPQELAQCYAPVRRAALELHARLERRLRILLGREALPRGELDRRQRAACPSLAFSERFAECFGELPELAGASITGPS